MAADAKSAADIADKRAKADILDRELKVERANTDREVADLRFKSEQRELFSTIERIKFLKDASRLTEEMQIKK